MPGCAPDAAVVIIGDTDRVAFDVGPSQTFESGSLSEVVWLGRGGPGSAVEVAGFVDGDSEGSELGDICVSCSSVL